MLTLDGAIMTTENDEYVYHEMITHPALQLTGDPKRVLIVGGDGGAARECLRYDSLEEVVVAEIDEMVVGKEFCRLSRLARNRNDTRDWRWH